MTTPKLAPADHLELGTWNAICDRCGGKNKAHQLSKMWNGLMACTRCWEPRQPQDFVRGVADPQPIPWARPEPAATFVVFCTPDDTTAVPDLAIPGCVLPGYINPANTRGF